MSVSPAGDVALPARLPRRRGVAFPRRSQRTIARPVESALLFLAGAVAYALLGASVVTSDHVVVFDALDRLTRAYMVWHNSPPKLAAVGFTFPPLSSLIFLPLAAIKPLATSLLALPLTSALFAGNTLAVLNRALELCEMSALLRYPLLALFALNPEFAFYAANGMPDTAYLFLLACGLYCLIGWHLSEESRYLIGAGLAFACCMLARYEFIVWALAGSCLVGAALLRREATRARLEGSVVSYLAPIVYGLALWTVFNGIIVGRPFGWIADSTSSTLAVNSDQIAQHGSASLAEVAHRLLQVGVGVAPLALVAIPALIAAYLLARDVLALSFAGFIALGLAIVGADALINNEAALVTLHDALPLGLTAMFGLAWLHRSRETVRLSVWLAALAVLAATLPLAWSAMRSYPFQNLEQAFTRAVETGKTQEGSSSIGGFTVGIEPERQMAAYINRLAGHRQHTILADNAQTFGVILLSGRPQDFLDRVDRGDGPWFRAREHPGAQIQYMLMDYRAPGDLIRQRYPQAASGGDPSLTPIFRTSRYVLLRVSPQPLEANL